MTRAFGKGVQLICEHGAGVGAQTEKIHKLF